MNKKWDNNKGGRDQWIAWLASCLREARRVLKPGHYALVWALPRTSHYTGMACEEAGFTVCDRIAFLYGSGFPKGKNKLKPAVEDWWLIRAPGPAAPLHIDACRVGVAANDPNHRAPSVPFDGPEKEKLIYHNGIGGRPYENLPAAGRWPPNVILSHAPGCVPTGVKRVRGHVIGHRGNGGMWGNLPADKSGGFDYADADGYEAVADFACVEGCPVRVLGEMSGECGGHKTGANNVAVRAHDKTPHVYGADWTGVPFDHGDTGTAARFYPNLDPPFFYSAKSSRSERNRGCDTLYWLADDTRGSGYRPITRAEYDAAQQAGERVARGNMHPCVKSSKLMSWLINLLTVPGDVILDPFAGSGSTGVSAVKAGRQFIGVEQDEDYMAICEARLAEAAAQPRQLEIAV